MDRVNSVRRTLSNGDSDRAHAVNSQTHSIITIKHGIYWLYMNTSQFDKINDINETHVHDIDCIQFVMCTVHLNVLYIFLCCILLGLKKVLCASSQIFKLCGN